MLRIGEVAAQAGVSVRALRYYEEQGLLEAERTPSDRSAPLQGPAASLRVVGGSGVLRHTETPIWR